MKNRLNPIRYFLILYVTLCASTLNATSYYVDATGGDNNNTGTSAALPWQTISKVMSMSASFQPGDNILFKKGEIWNGENLNSSSHPSGTSQNPITYSSYGTGAKPVITIHMEHDPIWTDDGGNIWSTVIGTGARFYRNGTEMLRAVELSYLGLYGTEYHTELVNEGNNLKLSIHSTVDPNSTADIYAWSPSSAVISLSNADYIHLVDLDFQGGASSSIRIYDNIGWEILNCNAGKYASKAIKTMNSSNITISHSQFDAHNTIDQSLLPDNIPGSSYSGCTDGIFVTTGSSHIRISNCFFKNWGHASFSSNTDDPLHKVTNITFNNNELTAPDIAYGGRLAYSGYSEDGEYYNNHIHDTAVANQLGGSRNHFHHNIIDTIRDSPLKAGVYANGIRVSNYNIQVRDNIFENNVIANTDGKGIVLYSINFEPPGEVSGNIFRNNIVFNCGTLDGDIAIQFHKDQDGQAIYNNIVKNNLFYSSKTTQTCLYQYNGTLSDVATFNSQDADIQENIGGDPLFVDAPNGDFHLQVTSPAIDAAAFPLSTSDYDGKPIPSGISADIGAFEYVNSRSNSILYFLPGIISTGAGQKKR